jgi:methyltransferase
MPLSLQPFVVLLVAVVPLLIVETLRSKRHERALRARGAIEPAGDVYRAMRLVYPGMFAAMTVEGMLRGASPPGVLAAGLLVFAAGKAIKWAAILTLGPLWTFHVLVVPGVPLVTNGPYRFFRHPNYLGLLGEILGVALMMGAPITGLLSFAAFGFLLVRRIGVEERALGVRR